MPFDTRSRRSMRSKLGAGVLAALTLIVTATSAQAQSTPPNDSAQTLALEGLDKLMKALGLFMDSIPQYKAPEVLPNGDIIIRRVHPGAETPHAPPPLEPEDDGSST